MFELRKKLRNAAIAPVAQELAQSKLDGSSFLASTGLEAIRCS